MILSSGLTNQFASTKALVITENVIKSFVIAKPGTIQEVRNNPAAVVINERRIVFIVMVIANERIEQSNLIQDWDCFSRILRDRNDYLYYTIP